MPRIRLPQTDAPTPAGPSPPIDDERRLFLEAVSRALEAACDGNPAEGRGIIRSALRHAQEAGRKSLAREIARVLRAYERADARLS